MSSSPPYKPNSRLRRAKSEITHNRISTETLRTEFRTRFFNRLRTTRSRSVDRFREIVEEFEGNIESVSDVRRYLLQDTVGSSLLETEEVNELLNVIEEEIRQISINNENEDHERTIEKETEDIVNRLLNTCPSCNQKCEETGICNTCAQLFSSDDK